ncbi:hypothetical protein M1B72_21040 [Geomonas paludis]|uniref:Uncharacterized protein n=1 Tax=Geomonas paludis TaxID=2740185 RepID=A0ABY4LD18_9BACT|nr:hypothetical protein [Geomonas paludis]UPU35896.1 hypothetical protein M1B72_21040 [Geomonas paludis]
MKYGKIPGPKEWEGYKEDLDVQYAHKLFFGKSVPEVIKHFTVSGRCIERADELLFMPRKAFQYYVFAFAEYLRSEESTGEPDAASPFINLLLKREKKDPGSVMEIYDDLFPAIDLVASNQERFQANPEIYGNFREKGDALAEMFKKFRKERRRR